MLDKFYLDIVENSFNEHNNVLKYKGDLETATDAFENNIINVLFAEAGELDALKQGQIDPASQKAAGTAYQQGDKPEAGMKPRSPKSMELVSDPTFKKAVDWAAGMELYGQLLKYLSRNEDEWKNAIDPKSLPKDNKNFNLQDLINYSARRESEQLLKGFETVGEYAADKYFKKGGLEINKFDRVIDKVFYILTNRGTSRLPYVDKVYERIEAAKSDEGQLREINNIYDALPQTLNFNNESVYGLIDDFLRYYPIPAAQLTQQMIGGIKNLQHKEAIFDALHTMFPAANIKMLKNIKVPSNPVSMKQAWDNMQGVKVGNDDLTNLISNGLKTGLSNAAGEIDAKINNVIKNMTGANTFNIEKQEVTPVPAAKPENASYEDELYDSARKYLEYYKQYSQDEIFAMFEAQQVPEGKPTTNDPQQETKVESAPEAKNVVKSKPVSTAIKTVLSPQDMNQRNEAIRYVTGFIALYSIAVYLHAINNMIPTNEEYFEGIISKAIKGALGHIGGAAIGLIKQFATGMPLGVSQLVQSKDFNKVIDTFMRHSESGGFADAMQKIGLENLMFGLNGDIFSKQNIKNIKPEDMKTALDNASTTLEKELKGIDEKNLEFLIKQFYEPKTAYAKGAKAAEKVQGALQKLRW